jgi:hypothetical protein
MRILTFVPEGTAILGWVVFALWMNELAIFSRKVAFRRIITFLFLWVEEETLGFCAVRVLGAYNLFSALQSTFNKVSAILLHQLGVVLKCLLLPNKFVTYFEAGLVEVLLKNRS